MKAGFSPLWSEGTWLTQQHFQCWEHVVRHERALELRLWQAHAYGILVIALDHAALLRGQCIIQRLVARHPNGEWIYHDQAYMPALSCEIGAQKDCLVSVVMPNNDEIDSVPGYESLAAYPGYTVEQHSIADTHHRDKVQTLSMKRRILNVRVDHAFQSSDLSMVIAGLRYQGGHQYALHERYIVPSLVVAAQASLMNMRTQILNLISARMHHLKHWVEAHHDNLAIHEIMILGQASQGLHADPNYMHPQSYYEVVCLLITHLGVLRQSYEEPPSYQHENLMETMLKCMNLLEHLLLNDKRGDLYIPNLEKIDEHHYEIRGIPEGSLTQNTWYLGVEYQDSDLGWVQRFSKQAKLAACSQLSQVVLAALPGVSLVHTQRPPESLVIKNGYEYFRIMACSQGWHLIQQEKGFGIYIPSPFDSSHLSLDVVKHEK